MMRKLHFPTLAAGTIETWEERFGVLKSLHNTHLEDFAPSMIDGWIKEAKELLAPNLRRCNLKKELKMLSMIFSWYINEPEYGDYKFVSPILKRHRKSCIIREAPVNNKKITPEDAFCFIGLLPPLYRDLALFQYLTASRISEAAGVQIDNIDLDKRVLCIKDCCVWSRKKCFLYLKSLPKNGEIRYCHINDLLLTVIERRLSLRAPNSGYLFHVDGKPLGYRWIQHAYVKAQKQAGVAQRSTHCLRHGMATLARKLTRSLDATMAMTGHKDIKLADHYSEIGQDVQKETSLQIEQHLKQILPKSAVLGCTGQSQREKSQ